MQYLCIVALEDDAFKGMTAQDGEVLNAASLAYDESLKQRGQLVAAQALQSPRTAVTVRRRGGKVTTTDGPFVELKEHIGGFLLIEAKDLNEAIQIASNVPVGKYGAIEVRPVMDINPKRKKGE